ncbi:hypothetical protein V6N13_036702 [Hibiscus sabdariffa]
MRVKDQQIKFNVLKSLRQPDDPEDCQMIQSTAELYFDAEMQCLGNSWLNCNPKNFFDSKHLDDHPINPGEDAKIKGKRQKKGPSDVKLNE